MISILIPVKNESDNLELLIPQIFQEFQKYPERSFELVIVNDNSTDNTDETVQKWQKSHSNIILTHQTKINGGSVGEALKKGLFICQGDYILMMDGDLSHKPIFFSQFFEEIDKGFFFIMGGRYNKSQQPFNPLYRFFLSRFMNVCLKIGLRSHLNDNSHGFRAFKNHLIDPQSLKSKGFGIYLEITKKFLQKFPANRITEINIRYGLRKYGESKLNLKNALQYIPVLLFY